MIYYPHSLGPITPELVAHEAVHGARQDKIGVENWWRRYISDPEFRLAEEIPAHQVEYLAVCAGETTRGQRRAYLTSIAKRLASPLYGSVISLERAKTIVKGYPLK